MAITITEHTITYPTYRDGDIPPQPITATRPELYETQQPPKRREK